MLKSYYLHVAIGEYKDKYWPSLEGPVNDLEWLSEVLEGRYCFTKLDLLKNEQATYTSISNWIDRLVDGDLLEEDSQLLIYFSCHGHPWRSTGQQYWIAYDGEDYKSQGCLRTGWIEAEDVIGAFKRIPCRHILLISDSCFSGRLINKYKCSACFESTKTLGYYSLAERRRSREIITSCGDEIVTDSDFDGFSPFAKQLTTILESNMSPVIAAEDLAPMLKKRLQGEASPLLGTVSKEHQYGGSFLFYKKQKCVRKSRHNMRMLSSIHHFMYLKFWHKQYVRNVAFALLFFCLYLGVFWSYRLSYPDIILYGSSAIGEVTVAGIIFASLFACAGFVKQKVNWCKDSTPQHFTKTFVGLTLISYVFMYQFTSVPEEIDIGRMLFLRVIILLGMSSFLSGYFHIGSEIASFSITDLKTNSRLHIIYSIACLLVWVAVANTKGLDIVLEFDADISCRIIVLLGILFTAMGGALVFSIRGVTSSAILGTFFPWITGLICLSGMTLIDGFFIHNIIHTSQIILIITAFLVCCAGFAGMGALNGKYLLKKKWIKDQ